MSLSCLPTDAMALDTFRQVTHLLETNDHLKGFVKQIRHANGTESIEMLLWSKA